MHSKTTFIMIIIVLYCTYIIHRIRPHLKLPISTYICIHVTYIWQFFQINNILSRFVPAFPFSLRILYGIANLKKRICMHAHNKEWWIHRQEPQNSQRCWNYWIKKINELVKNDFFLPSSVPFSTFNRHVWVLELLALIHMHVGM